MATPTVTRACLPAHPSVESLQQTDVSGLDRKQVLCGCTWPVETRPPVLGPVPQLRRALHSENTIYEGLDYYTYYVPRVMTTSSCLCFSPGVLTSNLLSRKPTGCSIAPVPLPTPQWCCQVPQGSSSLPGAALSVGFMFYCRCVYFPSVSCVGTS